MKNELTTNDIIEGVSDSDILWHMRSSQKSLKGGDIIDEDNLLFYVDGDLETINEELKDYFNDELPTNIKYLISVYYSNTDGELYAIWNN